MDPDSIVALIASVSFIVLAAFFVTAEFALVGARRSKIESLAKGGNRAARAALKEIQASSQVLAGIQIGITLVGTAIGSVTEPALSKAIEPYFTFLPDAFTRIVSILLISYPLVVVGELCPKYLTVRNPERLLLTLIGPIKFVVALLFPLVWLFERTGALLVRPFGIDVRKDVGLQASRDEIVLLVRAGREGGELDDHQAEVVAKALRLDTLSADDVMIHRMDIQWLDSSLGYEETMKRFIGSSHARMPVCNGDIDELIGVIYLQDFLKADRTKFELGSLVRPAEFVPETLSLDRALQHMRKSKTQILIVRDEYGGTAGMLTLEDIVEEVFGELDDALEGERPDIERTGRYRVTARSEVRYDELCEFLGREPEGEEPYTTETLAEIIVDSLGRVPKLGDTAVTPAGTLRVENMARRRITRISVVTKPELARQSGDA